ncbi:MAG TPA: hypothetical protein ENG36_02550 [Lentisphaerae bacterium]|nr:hypothetical protein [Lentisphaerota bacterium]
MKRLVFVAFVLLMAVSCGGGGVRSAPAPVSLGGFTLADVEMMGNGKVVAEVAGTASAPEVIVKVEGAEGLKAVYVTLKHPEGYHPVEVEFGEFLGAKEEVISLAVTGRHGEVPCGIIKVHPEEVSGARGSGEVMRVRYEAGADTAAKAVSAAPGGDENKPTDLRLIESGTAGTYILRWHERNVGDYDNSGAVSISDLTPLAMNFGMEATDENSAIGLADGDGNGSIGIADVTPIAVHFGTELAGYNVYVAGNMEPLPNEDNPEAPLSVMRPADPGSTRVEYEYAEVVLGGTEEVTVAPSDGTSEGVLSDPATVEQPEVPEAPENLVANANQAIGPGRILLTWSPNSEPDLKEYRLYRKAEGETEFTEIAVVPEGTIPLQYTDTNEGEWLSPGIEYTYYATAVNDAEAESDPSNEAANTPFFPAPPTTPENLDATDNCPPYGLTVLLTWDASSGDYLSGYDIYRQAEGEADFTLVGSTGEGSNPQYKDVGLTEGVEYAYKVQARDCFGQVSGFSNEACSCCSPYVPVEILEITIDGTTFGPNEEAHLTVDVTNPAASVTWNADSGYFPYGNHGLSVAWRSDGSAGSPQITVTADDGITSDDDLTSVRTTTMDSPGVAPSFTAPSYRKQSSPYIPFQQCLDNHCVITLSFDDYC